MKSIFIEIDDEEMIPLSALMGSRYQGDTAARCEPDRCDCCVIFEHLYVRKPRNP